jgi:RHS repeat-associated protein
VWADINGNGSLTTRYVRGDKVDELIARIDAGAGSNNAYWYLADHLGSARDIIDNSGTVKDSIAYDGFGNITSETNAAYRGRYAWTGREIDVETHLQYNRARYYDATTGRWISQDPMGFDAGDSNLYRYVKNGPTNSVDPSGLQPGLTDALGNPIRTYDLKNPPKLLPLDGPSIIPPKESWEDQHKRYKDANQKTDPKYVLGLDDYVRWKATPSEYFDYKNAHLSEGAEERAIAAKLRRAYESYEDFKKKHGTSLLVREDEKIVIEDAAKVFKTGLALSMMIPGVGPVAGLALFVQQVAEGHYLDAALTAGFVVGPLLKTLKAAATAHVNTTSAMAGLGPVTPQMIQNAVTGPAFLGGTRLTGLELAQIRAQLRALGIHLDIDLNLLNSSNRGLHTFNVIRNPSTGVVVTENFIFVRPGVTNFELHHELLHAINAKAFGTNFTKLTPLQREQYVFDMMLRSPQWNTYTNAERQFAVDYLHYRYLGNTHRLQPSPSSPFIGPP